MRDYAQVTPKFWFGSTGKKLRASGPHAQLVALYLLTCPSANMLGMYYLPKVTIAHECGLPLEGASEGLQRCIDAGFCAYDEDAEVVWVYEMAFFQIADDLKPADNRCSNIQKEYDNQPDSKHLRGFYDKYRAVFHIKKARGMASPSEAPQKALQSPSEAPSKALQSPFEAPSKPLRSQEQEQEQKQEQKQDNNLVGQDQPDQPIADTVVQIFEFWQKVMDSPKSKLDKDRKTLIVNALKNYSPADICKAIRGCSKTPHNMGKNDRNTPFNGLNLILRNAEKIDYFIKLDGVPARYGGTETIAEANARIMRELLGPDQGANVIDGDMRTVETEAEP